MRSRVLACVLVLAASVVLLGVRADASFRLDNIGGDGIAVTRVHADVDDIGWRGRSATVEVEVAPRRIYHGQCWWEPGLPPLDVMRAENTTGDPTVKNKRSSAGGCFQIVDGTWNWFEGYPNARSAPVDVQVRKAKLLMQDNMGICHWRETSSAC